MKKKTKSVLRRYNIEDALKGKESFVKSDEEDVKQKKLGLFDFVNDIRKTKSGELLNDESNLTAWNSYMTLQALSMKEEDIPLLNFFNKYTSSMTKKQMYQSLTFWVPKDSRFYKWISKETAEKDEVSPYVSKYFSCSLKEAKEYVNIMGIEWAESIKEKFGKE
jgi:succinate dehydrogenase flavin-adding protein (antitoxin of CptAB toxin-antitoxin module)